MTKGLDEILSGVEPAQVETPAETSAAEPAKTDPPRGEHGHFAPKEPREPTPAVETVRTEPAPVAERPAATQAPPGVLEERDRRKAAEEKASDLERQITEMNRKLDDALRPRPTPQPPAPPPTPVEFWDNPEKWGEQITAPIRDELAQTRFELSLQNATAKHGADVVEQAENALREAIGRGELNPETVKAQLSRSRSPVSDMVNWHLNRPEVQRQRLRDELRTELMAELGQQPAAEPQSVAPAPVMPSNLVGARNVGTRSGPAWGGPATLNDIFDRSHKRA